MLGNVWEWNWDWYGAYASGSQTDPQGPTAGTYRVLRGGSWRNVTSLARSAYRYGLVAGDRLNDFGFRIVRPFP
jgi:formylglycine-generating enzyme required for sulfatase activity